MKKRLIFLILLLQAGILLPACLPTAPDCSTAEVFCAGLVTGSGKLNDKALNQAAWETLQQAKSDGILDQIEYIETADYRDYSKNIEVFTDLGYDLIVTAGYNLGPETENAAAAHPETYFIGLDQPQGWPYDGDPSNDLYNLAGLLFPEDQAGFLAGAMAALMTETQKVGAVCASDTIPSAWRYGEGYRAGAMFIDPEVEVSVVYNNDAAQDQSMDDPEWGATTAGDMVDASVDVVFGAGGETGMGAILEAAARGIYVIGAEWDEYITSPEASPRMLTSAMKMITTSLGELIRAARDAQEGTTAFPAGDYPGLVGLAPYHDLEDTIPDEVKTRMEEILGMLTSGELQTGVGTGAP